MQQLMQTLHQMVWGPWTMVLFLGTGLFFTLRSGGFQIRGLPYWWRQTVGKVISGEENGSKDPRQAFDKKITAFQSSCTALAATIGTGNIVGVATALTAGGPGAVFWLWVSALIGMATAYAETSLGQKYRYRLPDGAWQCGPMVCMERGLGCKSMACLYAAFAVLASLGMGSMVQANAVSETLRYEAGMKPDIAAVLVTALTAAVIWGGIRRISRMTSWFMPLSAGIYVLFSVVVLILCRNSIVPVLLQILKQAWTPGAAGGGVAGFLFSRSVRYGMARGVFSNEAGLGTLAVLHGAAEDTTPEEQGMWAMFEVFFDTIVICTLTAMVILCVGRESPLVLYRNLDGAALTSFCFSWMLGRYGGILVSCSMAAFAFATIVGWYYIGQQMFLYLAEGLHAGKNVESLYTILYLISVYLGCVSRLEFIWIFSDLVNGLMAYPNLLTLWLLHSHVTFPFGSRRRGKSEPLP